MGGGSARLPALHTGLGAAGVAGVALTLYLVTLAPSITWRFSGDDSGDLASAVATWGIPHPTGYPLYVVLGGVFTHLLPFGQQAYRLNVMSAVCSAAAAAFVFLIIVRLSQRFGALPAPARYLIAATAALSLATCRTLWSQSVLAEVYALETLLAAVIAWLLVEPEPTRVRAIALAFVCGLALTNHTTIVFSLIGIVFALLIRYRRRRPSPRSLAGLAVVAMLPLLLYLLLPWRASQHPASNWGDPTTLGRFVDVVTGAMYHYLVDRNPQHAIVAIPPVVRLVFSQFAWWVVPLAILGVATLWEQDEGYSVYAIAVVLIDVGFFTVYRAQGRDAYLLQAFVLLEIAAGAGMLTAAAWLPRLSESWRTHATWLVAGLGLATVLPWLVVGMGDFNLRDDWQAWNYAVATLSAAAPGATVRTSTDTQTFALWYAQRAEHVRPDVRIVDTRFRDPQHQR